MKKRIEIRRARRDDVAGMVALEERCFREYRISWRQFVRMGRSATAIVLVAVSGSQVIGDAIGLVRRTTLGRSGRVYSLAVDPKWRDWGIGSRLLARLLEEFKGRRVGKVRLEVQAGNRGALALYRSAGFTPVRRLKNYYGQGRDGVKMLRASPDNTSHRPASFRRSSL